MSHKLKLEVFQTLFECQFCFQKLNNPVVLPCGNTVCKIHLNILTKSTCQFCNQTHHQSSSAFPPNLALEKMLTIELNKLTFNTKFTKCQNYINDLQKNCQEINLIQKDPSIFVYEYFEDLKREVDIRREDLKFQLDTYSNNLINEITQYQEECSQISNKTNELSKQIESLKKEMNNLIERFDTFDFSDEKFDKIIKDATTLKPAVASCLETFKSLLVNNKEYSFKFKDKINLTDFCGSIKVSPVFNESFADSTILQDRLQAKELLKLCEFSLEQEWKLGYRGTENGFSSKQFHSKSKGVLKNLIIVKSSCGNIFGGYTDLEWKPEPLGYDTDENSFIFSLVNNKNIPLKIKCRDPKGAIYRRDNFIAEFGNDLILKCDEDGKIVGESILNERYFHTDLSNLGAQELEIFLGGDVQFIATEVEMYYKVN